MSTPSDEERAYLIPLPQRSLPAQDLDRVDPCRTPRSDDGVPGGVGTDRDQRQRLNGPSEPKQPIDLHDQPAVAKLRETVGDQRIHVPVLGKDHEDFTAGTVLPSKPEIRAERIPAGAVLDQPAEKHARREGIGEARPGELGRKRALWQVQPVQRDARFERELGRDFDSTAAERHRRVVAAPEAPGSKGDLAAGRPLGTESVRHTEVSEVVPTDRNRDSG